MLITIRPLIAPLQEKAEKELNEVPSQVQQNLEIFKNWLSKQEHFKYRNDDQLLLNFLRGSKFSLQRAKEKIDAYYTCRTIAPEIAKDLNIDLSPIQKYFKMGICLPLPIPKETPEAPRLLLFRHDVYDPHEITLSSMIKSAYISCDILFNEDDNYVVSGVNMLWDMKNIQLKTALQATPTFMKRVIFCFEKAFPTRLKAFYIINVPAFFQQILNWVKLVVSKKLAKRLHFYSTNEWEAIFKDIPKSSFPFEYGGEGGHIEDIRVKWMKNVESNRKRLLDENNYYSDESKRRDASQDILDIFGIEGSFRKLEID